MKRTTLLSVFCLLAASAMQVMAGLPLQPVLDVSSAVTASDLVTYTVTNDATYPWEINEAGDVTSSNKAHSSTSTFTIDFSSEQPLIVTFKVAASSEAYYDYLRVFRDGGQSNYFSGEFALTEYTYYYPAGSHKLEFKYIKNGGSTSTGSDCGTFKDVKISAAYTLCDSITLSAAGTLGTEVLSLVSTLPEMKYLCLSGPVNSDDYNTLKNMTGLVVLDIKDVVTEAIPASQFETMGIRFITLPTTLKSIGTRAFYNSQLYAKLTLPAGLEEIGNEAFRNSFITETALPLSIKTLGEQAFRNCDSLYNFTFAGELSTTPYFFLYGCDYLKRVAGCANLKTIGQSTFDYCIRLEEIEDLQPVVVYPYAFSNCHRLKSLDLSQVTTLDNGACNNCDSLKNVNLVSLTSLGNDAFQYCDSLTSIVLPNQLTSSPSSVFYACPGLKEVTIGASMSTLGGNLFNECRNITKIYCNAPAPPAVSSNLPFYSTIPTTATLYVPDYAMVSYKLDDYWSKFTNVDINPNIVEKITITTTLELSSNARIPNSPDLTLNLNSHFTVNGNNAQALGTVWTNVANPNVYISGYYYPSTLISRCNAMTANEVHTGVYMKGLTWYYLCFPFNVNRSEITTRDGAAFSIRCYDGAERATSGTGNSWKELASDTVLTAGQGYIVQLSANDWIRVKATAETRNQLFTSTAVTTPLSTNSSASAADAGWNFVGNPYPAYYDIYYMDYTAPLTVWSENNKTYSAYSIADDDFALLPNQAFFVQCPASISSIVFQPEGRQISSTIEHGAAIKAFARENNTSRQVINLVLTNGQYEDRTRVVVNEQRNDYFEAECDASKMMSPDVAAPQLYTLADGIRYAINEGAQSSGTIDLGCFIPSDGTYTLSLSRADIQVSLYDAVTGETVDLQGSYEFTAQAGENNSRFKLIIDNNQTAIENLTLHTEVLSTKGGVSFATASGTQANIYTPEGKLIKSITVEGNKTFVPLKKGIYLIRVAGRTLKTVVH